MKYLFFIIIVLFGCDNTTAIVAEREQAVPCTPPVLDAGSSINPDEASNCSQPRWEVHFSPNGGCTEMVSRLILGAKNSIYVQAYSFTSAPIGQALVDAKNTNHVPVQILLDKSDETVKNTELFHMQDQHVPVWIDGKHAIAHNKVMVIDYSIVITGSFNFTMAAEKSNAENCIALYDTKLAHVYIDNWKKHFEHSVSPKVR